MKHPETSNEKRALVALYLTCLENMGGDCLADLLADQFTWVGVADLTAWGWSEASAKGTIGALLDKGLIVDDTQWGGFVRIGPDMGAATYLPEGAFRLADQLNDEKMRADLSFWRTYADLEKKMDATAKAAQA